MKGKKTGKGLLPLIKGKRRTHLAIRVLRQIQIRNNWVYCGGIVRF